MEGPIFKYYKILVYLRSGKSIAGIRHFAPSTDPAALKERLTKEAQQHYKEMFHYLDMWTMDERFTEVIDYKKEKGLE